MKGLLVLIRGWTDDKDFRDKFASGEFPDDFITKLKDANPDFDIRVPKLPMSLFSIASPESIVQIAIDHIDHYTNENDYDEIIILGYSSGGPIARSVYCCAWGADETGAIRLENRKPWAPLITRIIFLSGITRGWKVSSATPHVYRFFAPTLTLLVRILSVLKGGRSFILRLRRGSPFIITTKLNFLLLTKLLGESKATTSGKIAESIYLLGTQDEFMSPADCVDLGIRPGILYIEIPGSSHFEVLNISAHTPEAKTRARILDQAINAPFVALEKLAIGVGDIDDYLDELDRPIDFRQLSKYKNITEAVIVMHGIRDNGFWTKRISRTVKERANSVTVSVRAPTPSYGYFSLLDFANTFERERATRWFLEMYSEIKAYFPEAQISFVGHSNGTYLACHALEICSCLRFKNMVLAGSVVKSKFNWVKYIGRVDNVLNYVASNDLVVALLPASFEKLRLNFLNVGGAGFYGFKNIKSDLKRYQSNLSSSGVHQLFDLTRKNQLNLMNYRYVKGGHGAAIGENFWEEISSFILTTKWPDLPTESNEFVTPKRSIMEKVFGKLNHFIFILSIVILIGIFIIMKPFSTVFSFFIFIFLIIIIWSVLRFY